MSSGQTPSSRLKAGFTLIELLVVISIIAILATILLLQLNTARSKGRDAKRITDINQVRTALELYFDQNNAYPADIYSGDPAFGQYLRTVPKDPLTAANYSYCTSGATGYDLGAKLEQYNNALKSDSDLNTCSEMSGAAADDTIVDCTTNACWFDLGQQ